MKYLKLDPKPSDLTMIRIIKVRTGKKTSMSTCNKPKWKGTFCSKPSNCGKALKRS